MKLYLNKKENKRDPNLMVPIIFDDIFKKSIWK